MEKIIVSHGEAMSILRLTDFAADEGRATLADLEFARRLIEHFNIPQYRGLIDLLTAGHYHDKD